MSENSIDIALVQETYLKPNRPKACSIAGYVQLRTDRTYSSKGGTALYYRRSLHCGPINIPPLTNMEATGCRLVMTGHSILVIVSVYLPSPKQLLRRDLRALLALGDAVILFGALPTTSGQWSRRASGGSGILGSPEVSARYSRIDKSKKRSFAPRERISHSRVQIQSASSPTRMAIDDAEIAECLADSIETLTLLRTTSLISVASRKRFSKTSLEPKDDLAPVSLSEVQTLVKSLNTRKAPGLDGIHKPGKPRDLPASYRPISLLSGLGKLFEKILKTRLSDHLLGKGLIIDEQFGFRPAHSCPQQVLRLVEYVSEGFETERSTVAVFFDVAKAFDRSRSSSRLHSLPAVLRVHKRYTATVVWRPTRVFADDTALFTEVGIGAPDSPSSLQRAIDELGQWFRKWRIEVNPDKSAAIQFKTVMTYASPVFAAPKALHRLQGLRTPTISKYMKDASKRFFDIAGSHPNALLRAAVDYQPPHPTHLIRRPRNVIDLSSLLHPAAANRLRPAGGKEPTRDGFLRHPMPRRPPGVVHSACHAPSALACAVRPHSEEFFSGFQSHTTHVYEREGVQDRHFLPPPRRKSTNTSAVSPTLVPSSYNVLAFARSSARVDRGPTETVLEAFVAFIHIFPRR
ncbi:Probable RNA-directed DNA polymerase from transposon BS [Eumeta japonica]|uniref:Probable RNA-directed DNA polymerase from transposon BS n=1 Tax=Eumeta variegata TaxID=151549 RepID=A0A4C1W989_EUMVA|nr:Probable RNA-directed DNA polymerase from transposon BS [Eumeta japonica]